MACYEHCTSYSPALNCPHLHEIMFLHQYRSWHAYEHCTSYSPALDCPFQHKIIHLHQYRSWHAHEHCTSYSPALDCPHLHEIMYLHPYRPRHAHVHHTLHISVTCASLPWEACSSFCSFMTKPCIMRTASSCVQARNMVEVLNGV